MAPVINLSLKFGANIFIDDRHIAILLFCRFGCEVLIPAHFGEVFLGCDPLNVVGYCRDPQKAHSWPETRLMAYRSFRSVEKCDLGARWRKQKKKKRKKLRDLTSYTFAQTTHVPRSATPTKVFMWGGVPNVVNHARFRQNWLRGFGSLRGQNLPFSYT